jgi:hypothetical protein
MKKLERIGSENVSVQSNFINNLQNNHKQREVWFSFLPHQKVIAPSLNF